MGDWGRNWGDCSVCVDCGGFGLGDPSGDHGEPNIDRLLLGQTYGGQTTTLGECRHYAIGESPDVAGRGVSIVGCRDGRTAVSRAKDQDIVIFGRDDDLCPEYIGKLPISNASSYDSYTASHSLALWDS